VGSGDGNSCSAWMLHVGYFPPSSEWLDTWIMDQGHVMSTNLLENKLNDIQNF
jgi:hypothetical protein